MKQNKTISSKFLQALLKTKIQIFKKQKFLWHKQMQIVALNYTPTFHLGLCSNWKQTCSCLLQKSGELCLRLNG